MGNIDQLAKEVGASVEGAKIAIGEHKLDAIVPSTVAPAAVLTASTTFYGLIGTVPKPCKLVAGNIRSEAAGVGGTTTIDILKVPSGTAIASGTAVVTQVIGNALVAATDTKLAPLATGVENIAAGCQLWAKIVAAAGETLKPVAISLTLKT